MKQGTAPMQCTSAKCPGRETIISDMEFCPFLVDEKHNSSAKPYSLRRKKKNEGTKEKTHMETLYLMEVEKAIMNHVL